MTKPPRRFPPPWTVEKTAPCFIVRDVNKQAFARAGEDYRQEHLMPS